MSTFGDVSVGFTSFQDIHVNANESHQVSPRRDLPTTTPGIQRQIMNDESAGKYILSGLKDLQDKLRRLELNRHQVTNDLETWSNEKELYRNLSVSPKKISAVSTPMSTYRNDLTSKESFRRSTLRKSIGEKSSVFSIEKQRCCDSIEVRDKIVDRPNGFEFSPLNAVGSTPRHHSNNNTNDSTLPKFLITPASKLNDSVGTKCQFLEEELERMKRKVSSAEKDRASAFEKQIRTEREKVSTALENHAKSARLNNLQANYQDLASRNKDYLQKLDSLREELKVEKHQKQLIVHRNIDLETEAEAKLMLDSGNLRNSEETSQSSYSHNRQNRSYDSSRYEKPVKLSKERSARTPSPHYRFHPTDLPFLTGTSTSPSHAFAGRVQQLIHDLRSHKRNTCGTHLKKKPRKASAKPSIKEKHATAKESWEDTMAAEELRNHIDDVQELIEALENEFSQLTDKLCLLRKQLETMSDDHFFSSLNEQINEITVSMEQKGHMIVTSKNLRSQLTEMLKKKENLNSRRKLQNKRTNAKTSRSRPPTRDSGSTKPGVVAKQRRDLLRTVDTLHQVLKKDDLSWDC